MTTAEFFRARVGKLTASRMADAMAFKKDGKPSAERTRYLHEVVAERLTGEAVSHFVTPAMAWGLANEDGAKAEYEAATGRKVKPCGTIDHFDIEYLAATPDGYIGHDGLIETKCPTTSTHIAWAMAGVVPEIHKPQMTVQIMCTGRDWCDFVSFDPRIKGSKRLFIVRYVPTEEYLSEVREAAIQFLHEADSMFQFMTTEAA